MENNTPIQNNTNSFGMDYTINPAPIVKKPSKKRKIIIIVSIFILIALLVTYFFIRNIEPAERIPTLEEKMENMENVLKETEKIGLPPIEKQVDIMNYNQAE